MGERLLPGRQRNSIPLPARTSERDRIKRAALEEGSGEKRNGGRPTVDARSRETAGPFARVTLASKPSSSSAEPRAKRRRCKNLEATEIFLL